MNKRSLLVLFVGVALAMGGIYGWTLLRARSPVEGGLSPEQVEKNQQSAQSFAEGKTWSECLEGSVVMMKDQSRIEEQSKVILFLRTCLGSGLKRAPKEFCGAAPQFQSLLEAQQWTRTFCKEQGFGARQDCIRATTEAVIACTAG